ncbi:neuropeptide CCHamide-2 receptor-like [Onthophagus taurus]|uniref:neuropeptide CCHamide-2 receptor-like n=1 Tax=Onthophagus taurus TaxID=166361 RepID=UPI0039BDA472
MDESVLNTSLSSLPPLVTTPGSEYVPYDQRPETYIVPALFFMIFVVGVLGNGTLVVVFLRHKPMRNVPNTYILSLSLADLLLILTCVPFTSTIYTVESWPWGVILCKTSEVVKDISTGVSVFTLTALSAERYCAIVNPLRRLQTKPLTVMIAVLIWILAIILSIPDGIFTDITSYTENSSSNAIHICTPFPATVTTAYKKYIIAGKALVFYIVPLFVIASFYILMAKKLHASVNEIPGQLQGQSLSQIRARRNVARMVLCFVFLFFICFLPYHVFFLWFFFHPTAESDYNEYWHTLKIVGFCLSFSSSCVNPVALYCVSGVFRQYFNRYLFCKDQRRLQRTTPSSLLGNCETSFNSTYRKNTTQGTTVESFCIKRKNTILTNKKCCEATIVSMEPLSNVKNKEVIGKNKMYDC